MFNSNQFSRVLSKAPETTQVLGSIEPPHTTRAFGITQAPRNTQDPLTTQRTATTQTPQTTQEQLNTLALVTTQAPGTTQDPLTTQTPVTTQAPQTTQDPLNTQTPVTTQTPGTTQEPLNTQMPVTTQAPQTVRSPEIQLTLYIGQNKTIFCPVSIYRRAIIKWLYNSGKKDLPDGVVPDGINSLRITSVNKSHEGNFTCVRQTNSFNFGSAVHFVLQVIYPETCSRVKANISDASDLYIIDPDGPGGKASSFQAYCNMTDKEGAGVTVISHDSETRTHVDGCDPHGCYKRDLTYTGVLITQLEALTDVSARCEQFISYECFNSRLLEGGKAWWVSRDGRKMDYWGGTTEKRQCGCALTDSCAHQDKKCNCDYRDNTWHEDSGLLTEKAFLPVSQLRFGDTGKDISEGYHTLGKLKCYEMSTSHHQ